MAFSIRLSEEERQLADSYAKLHSMSMGEAFKRALFDKIEEEYDITAAEEATASISAAERRAARWVSSGRNSTYEIPGGNDAAI